MLQNCLGQIASLTGSKEQQFEAIFLHVSPFTSDKTLTWEVYV